MIPREIYEFGPYSLDAAQMLLCRAGSVVPLQLRALEMLLVLLRRRGEVVSKQELMEGVWPDSFVEEGNLTQNIFLLRRELGKTSEGEEYIQTVPKRGYRMNVAVRQIKRHTETEIAQGKTEGGNDAELLQTSAMAGLAGEIGRPVTRWPLIAMLVVLAVGIGAMAVWRIASARPTVSGYVRITHDGSLKRGKANHVGGPDAALFTDGSRIYFMEGSSDAPIVAQVPATGGETVPVPMPFPLPELMDFASGSSDLLVGGTVDEAGPMPLWAVQLPAGTAHRVGSIVAWDASWSPDGRQIAYSRGRELYLAKNDGSNPKLLATLPGLGWQPRWSPDGQHLRFTVFDVPTAVTSLWEVSREGTDLHPLLPGWNGGAQADAGPGDDPISLGCGSWTPDGRYFVFQVTTGGRSDIWSMPGKLSLLARLFPSLAAPVRLTSGQLSSSAPIFSPDGRRLFVIGQQLRGELERYDQRTGEFLPWLGGISASFVDFSRDGQWVAYVDYPECTLWRSRVDGSERLQLTFPPIVAGVPKWSPDGTKILFYGIGGGKPQRVYIVPATGGAAQPASSGNGAEMQANWSPDGASIIYSDFPFFSSGPGRVSIHRLNLATQKAETLPGSKGFFAPSWSPDGRYVAALASSGQRIMLYDFKTGQWSELAVGSGLLRWSRDSKYLYYLRYGPDSAVIRIRPDGGHSEEVAGLKGIRQAGRLAGLDFGLTPDGVPLILRDIGTQEIYSLAWSEP